ncbi:MAG: ABC transporter permease [Peptococcaceae bacterium]|jgi:hypothetical protein|nr:ABC transporter permease [Peptococcaceae bacterium]
MPFFAVSFRLHLTRMKKPLLLLSGMAFLLLLFGLGAAAAGGFYFEGRGFSPVTLAVADASGDSQMPQIMTYLGEMEDIKAYIRIVLKDPEEARAMVAEGGAAAALILPDDFVGSIYRGENFSPLLLMDSNRPLEVFGLSVLAENAGSMLVNGQKGSYFIQAVYSIIQPAEPDYYKMLWEADMKYAFWVLGRSDMYRVQTVSPIGGALDLPQHYLLSALLFFCFLAPAGVLYPIFAWQKQSFWISRLRGAGKPLSAYAFAQILWGAIAIFLLFAIVLAGLSAAGSSIVSAMDADTLNDTIASGGDTGLPSLSPAVLRLISGLTPRLSLSMLPAILLIAVFLSAFTFLCCNTGYIFSAVSLNFVLAGVFLTISGGFAPAVLLPKRISALSPFSPLTWMRDLLSPLYLPGASPPVATVAKLVIATFLLLVGASLYCHSFASQRGAAR